MIILLLKLLIVAIFAFYIFVKRKHGFWKRIGVPYVEPEFFFGNSRGIDKTIHHSEVWRNHYFKLKDKGPVVGFYLYTEPIAMITDPELMKSIFVKDFEYFRNRGLYLNEKSDPGTANILAIEDERWKNLRKNVSPLFTTNYLKKYFLMISEKSDLFIERIIVEESPEIRLLVSRFVIDTLGKLFMSVEFNQLKDGKSDMEPIVAGTVRVITYTSKALSEIYRWLLSDILNMTFFPKKTMAFMKNLVENILEERKRDETKTKHNDAVDALYKMHTREKDPIKFDEIWANASTFLIAGHDNLSSTIRHTLYELAINQDIQTHCRESIKEILKAHKISNVKDLTFEAVQEMTFVHQCVNETLRKYFSPLFTGRMTKYDYKVPNTDIILPKGTLVHSAIHGIQMNPDYYPNPEVWDPHRMHPSKMEKLHKYAFLPFGIGNHQCAGKYLAPLVAKTVIAKTILSYELEKNHEKMPEKLEFNPKIFTLTTEGVHGIYFKFKKIENPL